MTTSLIEQFEPHTPSNHVEQVLSTYDATATGRRLRTDDVTSPKRRVATTDQRTDEWTKSPHRVALDVQSRSEAWKLDDEGRTWSYRRPGNASCYKRYLDESKACRLQQFWDDIEAPRSQAAKSVSATQRRNRSRLLERIIKASSNENDIVLDAFCGCGTALVAAQKLKRQWIGIDISPTACRVMAKRLRDVCGLPEDEDLWKIGRGFVVRDLPWTEEKLRAIPPFEFENWAVIALGGIPNKTQVGDMGIDGRIFPVSALDNVREAEADELALQERLVSDPGEAEGQGGPAGH